MSSSEPRGEQASPPRVVMVVTNFVTGDSRVQKVARSAAGAGWDTVLVGRSRSAEREESTLGPARLLRVPVPAHTQRYRRERPFRGPLARFGYSSADQVRFCRDRVRVARAELLAERALAARAGTGGRAGLALRSTAVRLLGYWVEVRRRLYDRAVRRAGDPGSTRLRLRARWLAVFGRAAGGWRTQPLLTDYELSFGPVLDGLAPDVIHAHDVDTLGLAVRAKLRAARTGRTVRVVYDSHEYVAGVERPDPSWQPAMLAQERRYLPLVDEVLTVSDQLAGILRDRYRLRSTPAVVANAPERELPDSPTDTVHTAGSRASVRTDCGLAPDVPLLVYSGAVAPLRGLATVVAALPQLPGVHFAVQVGARHQYVLALVEQAERLGVADRLHVVDYVDPHLVTGYVASATAGVIPLLHYPAAEIAICTKYWEFMNARLPIVMSDVRAQAELTEQLGNGEVYPAGDAAGCAAAVRAVLADPERYRKAYDVPGVLEGASWESQVATLLAVYERLAGGPARR